MVQTSFWIISNKMMLIIPFLPANVHAFRGSATGTSTNIVMSSSAFSRNSNGFVELLLALTSLILSFLPAFISLLALFCYFSTTSSFFQTSPRQQGRRIPIFQKWEVGIFCCKKQQKRIDKRRKNAAKPFEARNSKEVAAHGQIPDSVKRKS